MQRPEGRIYNQILGLRGLGRKICQGNDLRKTLQLQICHQYFISMTNLQREPRIKYIPLSYAYTYLYGVHLRESFGTPQIAYLLYFCKFTICRNRINMQQGEGETFNFHSVVCVTVKYLEV